MRPTRSPHWLLLLAVCATLVLAACTPGASDDGEEADGEDAADGEEATDEPITLTLTLNSVRDGKNTIEAEWVEDYVIPTFEEQMADEGRDVTVEFAGTGVDDEDYKNQLSLDLRTEGGPDVFAIDGIWTGEFAQAEYIRPLSEVVGDEADEWEGWSQIQDSIAGLVAFEGEQYGIPVGTDGRVLFFNKELFAQAGLPEDWQPTSWEEILDAARQIAEQLPDVTPLQINAGVPMGEATTAQGVLPLLYGTGAQEYDQDAGTWLGDAPELAEVLGFYRTVYQEEQLGDPQLQEFADGRDRSFAQFADGRIAILAEGDYFWRGVVNPDDGIAPMENRDDVVGWAMFPAQEPGGGLNGQDFVSMSGGAGRVLNPNTEHPDEAWALLSFMHSQEAYEDWVSRESRITARDDVNAATIDDPMLQFIAEEVLPLSATRAPLAAYPQVSAALQEASGAVATGTAVEDALASYLQTVEDAVGGDQVAAAG
jgi:multiple sugar transport system substrate-binding protein